MSADPDEILGSDADITPPLVALLNIGGGSFRDNCLRPLSRILPGAAHVVPCIILSDRTNTDEVMIAVQQGMKAFLPASFTPELALQTIAFVIQGGTYFPRQAFLPELTRMPVSVSAQIALRLQGHLTKRQLEVLERLRVGLSNKSIGRDLDMQESTVKVHVRQIMRKLGANNRTQAAMLAGRLDSSDPAADPD